MSNLKNELENEKKIVHKFVIRNVERQRKIVKFKRKLAQLTTLHAQEVNVRKTLKDSVKRVNNRASAAEKENEDLLIDRNVQLGIGT